MILSQVLFVKTPLTENYCRIILNRNINLPCPLCILALLTLLTSQFPPKKNTRKRGDQIKHQWNSISLKWEVQVVHFFFFFNYPRIHLEICSKFTVWHLMYTKRKGICRSPYHLYVPAPLGCQIHPYNQNRKRVKIRLLSVAATFALQ